MALSSSATVVLIGRHLIFTADRKVIYDPHEDAAFAATPADVPPESSLAGVGATGNKTPGSAVGLATLIATGNPAGFIISTGLKVYGEKSGRSTVEGRAKQISQEIGDTLKKRFEQQGWIA